MPLAIGRSSGALPAPAWTGHRVTEVCSARHLSILWQNQHDRQMRRRFASLISLACFSWLIATGFLPELGARGQEPGARGQELLADAVQRLEAERAISA